MLKITIHDSAAECRFELAGELDAAGAAELAQSWETARSTTSGRRTTVGMRRLTSAGPEGRAVLDRMFREGVTQAEPRVAVAPRQRGRVAAAAVIAFVALLYPAPAAGAEPPEARAALDLYLAAPPAVHDDENAAMEIRARLGKQGRCALARVERVGDGPAFRLTAFEGDETVKRHVIARYLRAESDARERRDGSLAITAANYRFRFLRGDTRDGEAAFVYRVEPKRKSTGLFKGELWLEAQSGRVLRQSGKMVKNPSLFIREIAFTRDFDSEGAPSTLEVRLQTRIAGPAELEVRYESAQTN